jgi:hypothetical protein
LSVPKIIHFTWIGNNPLPGWARAGLRVWQELNPDHQIRVSGEEELPADLVSVYNSRIKIASKSDILRVCLIKKYGGWYADLDIIPLLPVDALEEAFNLDDRLMCPGLENRLGNMLDANACVFRGPKDSKAASLLIDEMKASERDPSINHQGYGPEVLKRVIPRDPSLFRVINHWLFYDQDIGWNNTDRAIMSFKEILAKKHAPNGAFSVHLWCGSLSDEEKAELDLIK